MFGYITVNKPELKIREYDRYRSYYCGLCNSLKERAGKVGQLTLTYDMTFLYLLLSGLYEPETEEHTGRCVVHPVSRHTWLMNETGLYTADMNLLMAYYKCLDDWNDDKKIPAGLEAKMLEGQIKQISERYPEKVRVIREGMARISEGEKADSREIDAMSGAFGEIMGELFVYKKDEWEPVLRRLGFFLGKFIYLMDAYEDVYQDEKTGAYNPLADRVKEPDFEAWAQNVLNMMMAECARAFEVLPIVMDAELMRNILYAGVWMRFDTVRKERQKKQEEEEQTDERSL